jgi:succinate dehydrogenase/fumarate reductase flavoprotein subunit
MRGSGIGNALFTSLRGGSAASRYSADAGSPPEVDYEKVKELKAQIFFPLGRDKGISAADAIYEVQNLVGKVKYNLRRNKDRLNEAISMIEERLQSETGMHAKDTHDLGKCHEAKNMLVCAEMGFRAALMRTESRGSHFREDYPERDDENWLKWIIIKQVAGKMVLSTEPVPIDKYKFKP